MEYTQVLYTTICWLYLIISVSSQAPGFNQNINQDRIYFFDDDQPTPRTISIQWSNAGQKPLVNQLAGASQAISNQPNANEWQQNANQLIPSKDLPRGLDTTRERNVIRLDRTSTVLTTFGINLMKFVVQQTPGNTVVSPHSIATLLALLQQGATGVTLDQLSSALQLNQQESAAAFKAYSDNVKKRRSHNILKTANNIFLADGFKLNHNFRAIALREFSSDVTPTNFANGPKTAQEINRWVAQRTDNMIQNLINPDSLNINTQMVLANAMYFKGLWEIPFRRQATTPGQFLLSSGEIKQAQFMQTRRYFKTGLDSNTAAKVVVVPFERAEYSLMIILPNTLSTLADTLSSLSASRLEEYLNFPHSETRLELPKFSIKADTDLSLILQQMGITKLFASSDLSNIGTLLDNRPPEVSAAVHSAAITIDEEGGSAGASTAFAVVTLSNDEPSVVFRANRPFLAVLWDGMANLPLFTAKIEDPTL